MNFNRLKGKSVLVTGADGFIGSNLTELLVQKCAKVKALSQYNSFNHWGWLEDLNLIDQIEVLNGDVRDPHYCKLITKDVDIVFHLAALIAIPYSYIAPDSYVDTNVKGTLNICQAALENGCEKVIHTSTSEVYGTAKYAPIDESHPLQPQSPYSATKIGADMIAMSFYHAFEMPVVIARPFNTYGPRQSARAVIPTVILQIITGQKEIKLGDVTPTRDFSYVTDTCRGFMALASADNVIGQSLNIGSNFEISIRETAFNIAELLKAEINIVTDEQRIRPEKSEVERLVADNSKIRSLTEWVPLYGGLDGFRRGLSETIQWFSDPAYLTKYKTGIYNL